MARWQDVMPERDRAVYEKAGFNLRQPFGRKPALLVIDVTIGFIGSQPADVLQSVEEFSTSCGDVGWQTLPNIKRLLGACRERQIPVVYTRGNPYNKRFVGGVTKGDAPPDDPELARQRAEIPELIAPLANEWILEKPRASVFFDTSLATYLRRRDVDTVLVTGCVTSGCVRASVVDAFSHGFRVFVVEEGVFDRAELSHLVSLYEMNAKYADVITLAEALQFISRLER